LIAGVATAIKATSPKTLVMGVESANCPGFTRSFEYNQPTLTAVRRTLADGLAVPTVGYNAFATAAPLIDKMLVVQEEWIALAILREAEVVVVLSGGNIDTTVSARVVWSVFGSRSRLVKFIIEVPDCPGGINGLCDILTNLGVSIKDIMHERAWLRDVYTVEVKVVCETRDWEHSMELKNKLNEVFGKVQFSDTPLAIENCHLAYCKK
ncbi:hypothetical protein DOY81_005510, partial [Sarcophaga bullata]